MTEPKVLTVGELRNIIADLPAETQVWTQYEYQGPFELPSGSAYLSEADVAGYRPDEDDGDWVKVMGPIFLIDLDFHPTADGAHSI